MEVPTKEQVFDKYMRIVEKRGFLKDCSEEEKQAKIQKAKEYFEKNYDNLERFPTVTIPNKPEEVTEEKKQEAEQHKAKGNEFFKAKDYSTAICEYERAIECNPFNHIYYSNRAACYAYLNNYELARRDCLKCIELDPSFSKGYSRLATACRNLGRLEEAKTAINKALALDPENEAYLNAKMEILDLMPSNEKKEKKEKEPKEEPKKEQPQQQQQQQQPRQGGGLMDMINGLMSNPGFAQMAQNLMSNPAMMNMAQNMMNNPAMRNMAQNMMNGMNSGNGENGQSGLDSLLNNPQLNEMARQFAQGQQGPQEQDSKEQH